MCMAETRIMPSRMPLFDRAISTWGVILMYSRCFFVRNVRYSVWNRILEIVPASTCQLLALDTHRASASDFVLMRIVGLSAVLFASACGFSLLAQQPQAPQPAPTASQPAP